MFGSRDGSACKIHKSSTAICSYIYLCSWKGPWLLKAFSCGAVMLFDEVFHASSCRSTLSARIIRWEEVDHAHEDSLQVQQLSSGLTSRAGTGCSSKVASGSHQCSFLIQASEEVKTWVSRLLECKCTQVARYECICQRKQRSEIPRNPDKTSGVTRKTEREEGCVLFRRLFISVCTFQFTIFYV